MSRADPFEGFLRGEILVKASTVVSFVAAWNNTVFRLSFTSLLVPRWHMVRGAVVLREKAMLPHMTFAKHQ